LEISDLSDDNACDDTFEWAHSQSDDTEESSGADRSQSDDEPLPTHARHAPGWKVMDF